MENLDQTEMKLVRVSLKISEKGVAGYFLYRMLVPRGMRGKTKAKVNEILAVGVPAHSMQRYCNDHHYCISNYYVYQDDKILLEINKEGTAYVEVCSNK